MYNSSMDREPRYDVNTCGSSPVSYIFDIVVGGLMVLVLLSMAVRPFRSFIPLASGCSVAISAAWHLPMDDVDAAVKPVIWGEIKGTSSSKAHSPSLSSVSPLMDGGVTQEINLNYLNRKPSDDIVGQVPRHCCFRSFSVSRPEIDQTYA